MKNRPEPEPVTSEESEGCPPHFWDIALARGVNSNGVCRKCGEEKTFANHVPNQNETHRGGRRPKREAAGPEEDPTEERTQEPPSDRPKPGSPWRQLHLGRRSI